ncbi:MAG: hypothetical protein HOC20_10490 [Chloroflexi bacterium]|nr:hypothetical protein [Chloroflexota bacterium]
MTLHRTSIKTTCLLMAFIWSGCTMTPQKEPLSQNQAQKEVQQQHCQFIKAGEIGAIIGDGSGFNTRPGVWSLSSRHRPFNAFKTNSSGLLCGEFRGKARTRLEYVDDSTAALVHEPHEGRQVYARATYRAVSPYYIDHELTFRDLESYPTLDWGYRDLVWCCYMNSPDDLGIYFISDGKMVRFATDGHGEKPYVPPSYLSEDELEKWPESADPCFWWERSGLKFDQPFYYGRQGDMVMILVFDQPRWIRFFMSSEGGGTSLIPGLTSTAWDFEYIIPESEYEVGRDYKVRLRLIYKKYEGDEDVLFEVRKAQRELGFETVSKAG